MLPSPPVINTQSVFSFKSGIRHADSYVLGDSVWTWDFVGGGSPMDRDYFRLRARPFRATPDTQFYYPATPHEFVLGRLTRALNDDDGIVLLTGEPGAGKT